MPRVSFDLDPTDTLVTELRDGDYVDLEGDPYADPKADPDTGDHPFWAYEYGIVIGHCRETEDCIRLDFENGPSCGFPVDHKLPVHGHRDDA